MDDERATVTLESLRILLAVQHCDSELDAIAHKLAHVPAQQHIRDITTQAGSLRERRTAALEKKQECDERQAELEAELKSAQARIDEINRRLFDANSKIAPDDALKMSHEVDHLKVRVGEIEDSELALLESREPIDEACDAIEREVVALREKLRIAQSDLHSQSTELAHARDQATARRSEYAANVPAVLLARYEQDRVGRSTPLVARVEARSCGSCHLQLSSVERDALNKMPESELIRCGECNAILVR